MRRRSGSGRWKQVATDSHPRKEVTAILPEALAGEPRQHAARLTGSSPLYVAEAKRINAEAPDVFAAVKGGHFDLATGRAAAKLPEAVRDDLLPRISTATATARKEARREIEHNARTADRPTSAHAEAPPQHCDIRLRRWGLPET